MKKYLRILLLLLIFPGFIFADQINSVKMEIDIDSNGNAKIIEYWDVLADSGTEWYKALYNLGNSDLTNYRVWMDDKALSYKEWNVDESLSQKKGYYGINYTSSGIELCFGKGDFKKHSFRLEYELSNYILNTSDSQVLYWTLVPNATMGTFSAVISSYKEMASDMLVSSYGYKGKTSIEDGKIYVNSEGSLNGEYVVLLAKFPLETFNTTNSYNRYDDYETIHELALDGAYRDDDDGEFSWWLLLIPVLNIGIFVGVIIGVVKLVQNAGYGYVDNKKINKKEVPYFRDIPFNGDIYYAKTLMKVGGVFLNYSDNIFGSIILKWIKENKILFRLDEKNKGIFDLRNEFIFDNEYEKKIYNFMKKASDNGILTSKKLRNYCSTNYREFNEIFTSIEDDGIKKLKEKGYLYSRKDKKECKFANVLSNEVYEDTTKLYGLKKFLEDFSNMKTKETMEVKLWNEYLMFAALFGIADKVAKQLDTLNPNAMMTDNGTYMDYHTFSVLDSSYRSAVNSATAAASDSGGGSSFSGGGGGSFGGGGSMGGR